jgi:hypothetical protein
MTLGEKYREAMDRIAVTEAMRGRILEKLRRTETAAEKKVVPFPRRRRYWALAACLALLVTGALVLPHALPRPQTNPAGSGEPPCAQNANSIVEYPSAQALFPGCGLPGGGPDPSALPRLRGPSISTPSATWRRSITPAAAGRPPSTANPRGRTTTPGSTTPSPGRRRSPPETSPPR